MLGKRKKFWQEQPRLSVFLLIQNLLLNKAISASTVVKKQRSRRFGEEVIDYKRNYSIISN